MSDITPPTILDKLEDNLDTRFRDVFISYGRAESKAFAAKLCERLTQKGYKVWFDQNDIPLGVDFQHQIDEGIETAHNFIFIIAPHAVKSPYCRKEIELAVKRGKRIIPILQIEPTSKEVWDMMHPTIGKINWVYMRQKWEEEKEQTEYETIDDFDTGFEGVLTLLEQEQEYVKRHTEILLRAIEWEKNHHNSMHLLVANERKEAEKWLFYRFETTQPPCRPSDLHVRFISEAKKNANNLQTDVFIASAEKEKEGNSMTREQVIYMLALHGYTSWTHVTDLNSGVDFHKAIRKGVEGADNLIFLITKESLASEYCMEELEYAISLEKRIIPLCLEKIAENELPKALRNLQYIDFTDNKDDTTLSKNEKTDFERDIDELLAILDADKEYIQRHKILLTQALKWERQDKNASMLLRGHNLEQAKIWLKIGQKRETQLPLPIHEDFIKESQAKSSSERTDVFVSYSRTDGDIARKLNESLQIAGKTTWFDQESIASGADFQKEIYEGIQNADNIVFILSPESILSPYCADEVEFAQKLGKRFVTLLYREIDTKELPTAFSTVQWIDFRTNYTKFDKQFAEVLRTLDTDREHVQAHTKWQNEAMEWVDFDRGNDFLLRGNEVSLAKEWIDTAKENKKVPLVTDLQEEFIKESLKQEGKVKRAIERNKQIAIAAVAIILAVAMLAGSQWYKSYKHQQELAIKNLVFKSKEVLETSPDRALQLAYEAYKADKKVSLVAVKNLYHIIEDANILSSDEPIFTELKAEDTILSVVWAKDKSRFVTIGYEGLILFDGKGRFIKKLSDGKPSSYQNQINNFSILNHDFNVDYAYSKSILKPYFVALSDDGNYIITHSDSNEIIFFDKNGNKTGVIKSEKPVGQDIKLDFIEKDDSLFIVAMEGVVNTDYYPRGFSLLDKLGNKIRYYDEDSIDWGIQNELYNKVARIWQQKVGDKKFEKSILKRTTSFILGNHILINDDDNGWKLVTNQKQDSTIITYNFPEKIHFSNLDPNYAIAYNQNTAYIFAFPDRIQSALEKIPPLSAREKIENQVAKLDDYRQVPEAVADMVAKGILFLTVFLLSILVLNYMNMLFLAQKYFKIIIYLFVGFFIGVGWFIFIMTDEYVIPVAFSSGISLVVAGIFFGIQDLKRKLYFNGTLFTAVAILLGILSLSLFHYTNRAEGFTETLSHVFGGVNIFIWIVVGITWFATEKAAKEFSQRNFNYFADWIGILVSTISFFIVLSITKFSLEDNLSFFFLILIFPFIYLLRTFIHQYVLYTYQKAKYSLTILRMYIPVIIMFPFFATGAIIEFNGGTGGGSNYLLIVSAFLLLCYIFILYVFTIFVAFKQKDRLNLIANFFFWWTAILLIFVVVPSVDEENTSIFYSSICIIWFAPLAWMLYKFFKKRNIEKHQTVEIE
ncbi:TIR domain-containing protein [Bernardetia sp. ABR2-2B]|uniref:toll/interleukin-1 receptor domain-containing protein n=1 Tax=Bernardetia sp. ABR2-2B TaxID=3127472 RepID=UPI0030CCBCC1